MREMHRAPCAYEGICHIAKCCVDNMLVSALLKGIIVLLKSMLSKESTMKDLGTPRLSLVIDLIWKEYARS